MNYIYVSVLVFILGVACGASLPRANPKLELSQRMNQLHNYMKEPITRWAWKNEYCKKGV